MTTPGDAAALIRQLRAAGITQTDVARAVGRSPRFLRFIEQGQKPAPAEVQRALGDLLHTGRVLMPAARRAQAVRAPGGATVTPPHRPAAQPVMFTGGGGRVVDVDLGSTSSSRSAGNGELYRIVQRAAMGRRHVSFVVTFRKDDGSRGTVPLGAKGGYLANWVLAQVKAQGSFDVLRWLLGQLEGAYAAAGISRSQLLEVQVAVF